MGAAEREGAVAVAEEDEASEDAERRTREDKGEEEIIDRLPNVVAATV